MEHPNYAGMPDVRGVSGDIQWEAPSNRKSGRFRDTYRKRDAWWAEKAREVGIDPSSNQWISRTAKKIHPTGEKPCKVCGRVLDIAYAYPNRHLIGRLQRLPYVDESFPIDPLEHISSLVTRMVEQFGDSVFEELPALLGTKWISVPELEPRLEVWLKWIAEEYIPHEPSVLSPGVMSNAPDRLDGFHSFNICCRGIRDKGRSKENLQSYTTDRRVFEYWVDGDWVAADRLMGIIRSDDELKREPCLNGHPGPCSADHIGPISLGFAHRPEFQFLCKACNSGKNNRMYASDVEHLRRKSDEGETVASWYSQKLWELRRDSVVDEETARRLSKLLRDNRHTAMHVLDRFRRSGHHTFLATFLGLHHANHDISFEGLRVEDHRTRFDNIRKSTRTTEYATEQKARRIRVAFSALRDYVDKESRNALNVCTPAIDEKIAEALSLLDGEPLDIRKLDDKIRSIVEQEVPSEEELRSVVTRIPTPEEEPDTFRDARARLREAMDLVAAEFSDMWDDDRYVRTDPLD